MNSVLSSMALCGNGHRHPLKGLGVIALTPAGTSAWAIDGIDRRD